MKRWLIVLIALVVLLVPSTAFAATYAEVTVTATPTYIALTNSEGSWALGTIAESSHFWWTATGAAPAEPFVAGDMKSIITNTGSVNVNITVTGFDFTGVVGWALGPTVGSNIVVMKAGKTGDANEAAMVTLTTGAQGFITALPHTSGNTIKWCMKLSTGTFTDGSLKTGKVTLTASQTP